ncbi:hypothetical protein IEQ34_017216 [Dendrobium chrysotoxum]|uniref:Uncharacterized protein n=1 Tax=Dendrobium chrysotoxum TaxID=161865 RepID=A0AAV7G9D5_DENCH|nr:hypothetical protein IEQ34_017216 [Dendrobium chrysotoxum]
MWGRDLVDIHLFFSGGNDFYLRLAAFEFDDHKKGLEGYVIVIIVLSAVVLIVGGIYLMWKCMIKMKRFYRRLIKRQS